MLEFIEIAVKLLVDKPDEVKVNIVETEQRIIYELTVGEGDYGKVIGKHGRNISALRTIVFAVNAKQGGKRARLDVIDQYVMSNQFHPIAEITTTSGFSGEVRLKPFSRYSIDYIMNKSLQIGTSFDNMVNLKLEKTIGNGKRMRFKFEGINSHNKAKDMVGKLYMFLQMMMMRLILLVVI